MNQLQEEAAYYAVITAPVRYDPELSSTAKLLYSEITSLCRKKGYCWANNSYFAELYGVSASTISRLVSQLESRGYIKTEIVPVANGSERRIYADPYAVNHAGISHFEDEGQGSQEGGTQKAQDPQGGTQKAQGGLRKNSKGGLRKKRKQNDYHMNDYTEDTPYSPPQGDRAPVEPAPADKSEPGRRRFVPPSVEQVAAYCRERGNSIDPDAFVDYYTSKGWTVGRSPMKDWKAAVRTWEQRRRAERKDADDEDDLFQ